MTGKENSTAPEGASAQSSPHPDPAEGAPNAERASQATPAAGPGPHRGGLGFAKRMYGPRVLGLALGFLAVASVLYQDAAHALAWVALAANAFVWPHLAYAIAARSENPYRAEIRNLYIDSAAGGAWVAVMAFNLLPSVLVVAMLSMDKLSIGGAKLLTRSSALLVAACAATAFALGFEFRPTTTMLNVVACLPLLVAYPIVVGMTTYRLSRMVQDQNRALAEQTRIDGLSGLLNRTAWEQVVANEFTRYCRTGYPVSLLMLDIDHFKEINDRYGHPAGDEVIRSIAALVRDTLRGPDTVGRYGGEEFGVVLPDTDAAGAVVIAERIRERVERAAVQATGELRCTVSIGIAEATVDLSEVGEWIVRADRALYRAKALGRNRTVRSDATEA